MENMISFLNFTVLVSGKKFIKNFSAKSFHVEMKSGGKEFNKTLAQSLRKNKKSLGFTTFCDAPIILKASLISKNSLR